MLGQLHVNLYFSVIFSKALHSAPVFYNFFSFGRKKRSRLKDFRQNQSDYACGQFSSRQWDYGIRTYGRNIAHMISEYGKSRNGKGHRHHFAPVIHFAYQVKHWKRIGKGGKDSGH